MMNDNKRKRTRVGTMRRPTITYAYVRSRSNKANRRRHPALRRTNRTDQARWGVMVLAALAIGIYVFAAGSLGDFLARRIFVPLFGDSVPQLTQVPQISSNLGQYTKPALHGKPIDAPASPSGRTETEEATVVREIAFPELSYYALQLGAFSTQEAAQEEALRIQKLGGAGYVVSDVRYRVFASLYFDRDDAHDVKEKLMLEQGRDSYVYTGTVGALELTVTAPAQRIERIVAGYDAWRDALVAMQRISDLVDRSEMTVEEGGERLGILCDTLEKTAQGLTQDATIQDESGVLEGLYLLLSETAENVRSFCQKNNMDAIAFGAQIKYNYIGSVMGYRTYIETISANAV